MFLKYIKLNIYTNLSMFKNLIKNENSRAKESSVEQEDVLV